MNKPKGIGVTLPPLRVILANAGIQSNTLPCLRYCLILFAWTRIFFSIEAEWMNHLLHLDLPFSSLFMRLDSQWYMQIVDYGYNVVAPSGFPHALTPFFPLFPLLVKIMTFVTGSTPFLSGPLVSNACFFGALCLFYQMLESRFDTSTARLGCLLLAVSPYNIYFMAGYTESLYLLLMLGFWMAAQRRHWLWMGIMGGLMSATHPNGVLIGVFALWFIWEDAQQNKGPWRQYWPIVLIPLGLVAYMVFLYFEMGDPLAFLHYQVYWDRKGWHLHGFWSQLLYEVHTYPYSVCVYVLGLALSVLLWRRQLRKEALFIPVFLSMAIVSGSLMSLARFTGGAFSFYLGWTLLLQDRPRWQVGMVMLALASSIPLMYYWLLQMDPAF